MKQFFKFMFASLFGFILGGFLLIFILIGIIGGIAAGSSDESSVSIKENSILSIKLNYIIPDRTSKNPFANLPIPGMEEGKALGLNDVLANIKKASTDNNIKGILLGADVSPNAYANLEEIRNALIEFKKSKKFIISYAEIMDEHSYYVASVSDKIYLNPSGEMLLNGFSQQVFYIKGMLDKIGLKPELIRHGKYKAAGEPLIADKMSQENRNQIESYMGSLYEHFLINISKARNKDLSEVKAIVNELRIQSAQDAVTLKMIDGLKYQDEVDAEIKTRLSLGEKDKISLVAMSKYKNVSGNTSTSDNKIAVLYCVGDIVGGEGDDQTMGSDRIAAAIKKIREDDSYKALVLRINSPGGSALASDIMWREISLCKAKKPVVVSMGDVAASGGYFIAAPADVIVAQPNTITGSIGVFGLLMNAQELLNNKLGIKIETVKFGEFSDLGSPDRPLNEAEKKVIQKAIDHVYSDFIKRVAEGRKLTEAQVDSIAQGRVWSGVDAKRIGLVDELGGLDKAIEIAAKRAKLMEYRCVDLPDMKDPFQELFSSLNENASTYFMKRELGTNYREYVELKKALRFQGIQARMRYDFKIE
ncbi:MAG: signal peptide peptidase SppA [Bacteroidetes bacterium B1(2017)]|nr:MAG: signal peptide peptidase SppA [Bacteroidetes bacterium B1(2017)]